MENIFEEIREKYQASENLGVLYHEKAKKGPIEPYSPYNNVFSSVTIPFVSNRLFVGSLPWIMTSDDLRSLFSNMGNVVDAVVLTDKQTGKSKGFGFVEMSTVEEAKAAAAKFNGYEVKGRTIVVNVAEPKSPRTLFMG